MPMSLAAATEPKAEKPLPPAKMGEHFRSLPPSTLSLIVERGAFLGSSGRSLTPEELAVASQINREQKGPRRGR
jgi:hypothetical protein